MSDTRLEELVSDVVSFVRHNPHEPEEDLFRFLRHHCPRAWRLTGQDKDAARQAMLMARAELAAAALLEI